MACGGFVVKVDQQAIPPMAGGAHGVDPAPRHDGLEVHAASLPGTAPTAAVLFRTTGFGVRVLVARDDPARRSEEHTSELQSLMRISYAVFCLKTKTKTH